MAAEFIDEDISGSRFVRTDLSGVVMRGVDVAGADIDAPWLLDGTSQLLVNGVDVAPLVDAELDRRFDGRALRRATSPDGLREAWSAVEQAWEAAVERAAALPPGTVEMSVDGEFSFAQTLRHLVMATDVWLGRAILHLDDPLHPIGQPHAEYETDGLDMSVFMTGSPSFDDVLEVRATKVARVRDFLADVSAEQLGETRRSPWSPEHPKTVLSCLHTILGEEWDHLRYALRDLASITAL